MLARLMSEGQLVPARILLELIAVKMLNQLSEKKGFILSGFPREKRQCEIFDREVRPPDLVLFLDVRNSVLSDRIMARSVQTTERLSMNFDYIRSRIKEFHSRNKPIIKYYKKSSLLRIVDAEDDAVSVFETVCDIIDDVLANLLQSQVNNPVYNV
ncbi:adenylate kinase isoenzyme 1 [Xylocopa sonorina]|uniref:adenylate kinase isoenzyme 1 n=1 Tax=Xylocopa sonorina TaxID=1818115 RepID=UPI00403AE28E